MEANEAPERLYLSDIQRYFDDTDKTISTIKYADDDVEYTRTDAFIEKALAYLHNKFYFNNLFYGIVSTDFNTMEELYEDFRKNMKGE